MNWSDLGLAKKLTLPIAVLAILLATLSVIQISNLNTITAEYSHINEQYLPALELTLNADRDLYQAQIAERSMALGLTADTYKQMHKENLDQVATRLKKIQVLDISADAKKLSQSFLTAFERWRPKSEAMVQQVLGGSLSTRQATEMSTGSLENEFEGIRETLNVLGEKLGEEAKSLQKKAEQAKNAALRSIFILVGVALLIALLVAVYFPRLITRPVNELARVLGQMADGKGDLSKRMPDLGRDEIGLLSHNFNRFLGGMQQMIGTIQQVALDVASTTNTLKKGAGDSQRISGEYAGSMELVATANHEMGLAIQEVSSNTQQVSEEAKAADQSARAVSKQFRQAMEEIQALAENVDNSGAVIQELVAETTNIASVLDVIKGIAEQTNLLALNAAIEAARAGEQGRGFAVVADEVRTLASKTQQSTGDINVMIEKLRSGVNRAVSSMKESQEKAVSTVEYASKSEENIRNISGSLLSISDRILQVASAIEEQTSVINNINENLSNAKHLSDQGMQSASSIRQAVDGLNHQASSLRDEVSSFSL
ncbi:MULTISPECIES: methyl-accepting chemotaxis protein [Oceanospirillaceae]|jgi:methyl-accepting chemotaxis protein|uniref:methyl-accepting chemotaxis protein n=1 Tax=Oceanospirillaceae TaxID=135620 RepID=UPI0011913B01|nr:MULTISPECIES: methyl-accepting chemotaxis protein [Thalassolituus]MCB2388550.1 methyl-accepting chemotaxis protein [Thalassolituus alkanivorans]MCB2423731.1 methyl-accepting chemotaxis protein [Thalassolituus alkanivorans]TVV42709.1 methyl-accepting chemotaxis protein [Thalassolituus sp. C2-1]